MSTGAKAPSTVVTVSLGVAVDPSQEGEESPIVKIETDIFPTRAGADRKFDELVKASRLMSNATIVSEQGSGAEYSSYRSWQVTHSDGRTVHIERFG